MREGSASFVGSTTADGLVRKAGNPGRQELGNLKRQTSKLQVKGVKGLKGGQDLEFSCEDAKLKPEAPPLPWFKASVRRRPPSRSTDHDSPQRKSPLGASILWRAWEAQTKTALPF